MTLVARLRSLRRQAGATAFHDSPSPDAVTATALVTALPGPVVLDDLERNAGRPLVRDDDELRRRMMSLRRVLGQRDSLREVRGSEPAPGTGRSLDRSLPGIEVAPGVRLLERSYARPPLPDAIALGPLRSLPQQRHARLHDADGERVVDGMRLLAIDTETTGLAGGTGTRAFMIGVADIHADRLRVRQLLTTTLGGEAGMLRIFCEWLRADHVLVSYNGRSYDRPLLSTRLRLARLPDPLPALTHLDLLHVTRRAYRDAWPNCRLATAERELLGVVRDDDLPGAEAPAAWLTFLRGGSSVNLRRVAVHNDQDLRSLMGLVAHFATALP